MSEPRLSSMFLSSTAQEPPLRIGLLLDGPTLDRASASIVRDIQESDFARIELAVVGVRAPGVPSRRPGSGGSMATLRRFRAEGGFAFALFALFDRWRTGRSDDPLEPDDDPALLAAIPSLVVAARGRGTAPMLSASQVEQLRAARLDVLVHLGSGDPGDEVHAASRLGVWAIRHGDDPHGRGPAGFRELAGGNPVCDVVLVRLDGDGGRPLVLDRATFATDPTSLARTRRMSFYGSTHLVIRNLRLLHERGWDWLAGQRPVEPGSPTGAPIDRRPSAWDVVRWFVPLVAGRVAARIGRTIRRTDDVLHWRIAIRVGGPGLGLDQRPDLTGFRWMESPAGHFYADPFVVERDGRTRIFFEDYSYARSAAVIAVAEVDARGELSDARAVLASSGHLSYPMIVSTGTEDLMIPESAAEGVVRVHRATAFPDLWTEAGVLFSQPAVDTTAWFQDGRWWFFTTVYEPRGGAGMLLLFHAPTVDGTWVPHPLNPISQDVRTSRGGGNLFVDGDRLVRPAQDGSRGYGYSLRFNEITVLSEEDYAERPGPTITPDGGSGLLGIHTYNRVGAVEAIDGKVSRPRRSVA